MIDYPSLRAVAAVVRCGSFERAAALLGVTPSAVSQRVRLLEERLGGRLVVRGSPCRPTAAGEAVCRHAEAVGLLEAELLAAVPGLASAHRGARRPTLSLAVNAGSLATWFLQAVCVHVTAEDRLLALSIDDEAHTLSWLEEGRVLAAVTAIARPVPGCRVVPLGSLRYRATASPDFVGRHFAGGVTAATLTCAPALIFDRKDRLQDRWMEAVIGQGIAAPTHWLPSSTAFVEASLLGLGWGMNPQMLVSGHLEEGRLVEIVPGTPLDVPLYWQVARSAERSLETLTRAVRDGARSSLVPSDGPGAPSLDQMT